MDVGKPTILILVTHTGGGHLNLAQALRDRLSEHYRIVIVNAQSRREEQSYAFVSRYYPRLLTWQFACTDNRLVAGMLQRVLALLNTKRFMAIIEQVQPQLIITTHAFLAYTAARANALRPIHVPLAFQLTDLGQLHMTWFVEKCADAYLAPSQEIFVQTRMQGIAAERIHLTGRPIRQQFLDLANYNRRDTLAALYLDPTQFTIFLQGGAKGSAGIARTVESFLFLERSTQIILAAGSNAVLARRYAEHPRVRVLPFTPLLAPYMAAADLIAGKAGASFISEAFMLEKPFLATVFIPGQETANLRFIERHNLGWVCLDVSTQRALMARIVSSADEIAEKVESIRAYKAFNLQANAHILVLIDRLVQEQSNDHLSERPHSSLSAN